MEVVGLAFQARKLLLELLDRRDEFGKPLLFLLDDHGWRAGDKAFIAQLGLCLDDLTFLSLIHI